MWRRPGIAVLLIIALMIPLVCMQTVHAQRAASPHACCGDKHETTACDHVASAPCCAAQAPYEKTPWVAADLLKLPCAAADRLYPTTNRLHASVDDSTLSWPQDHSQPGLFIARTIVLRI